MPQSWEEAVDQRRRNYVEPVFRSWGYSNIRFGYCHNLKTNTYIVPIESFNFETLPSQFWDFSQTEVRIEQSDVQNLFFRIHIAFHAIGGSHPRMWNFNLTAEAILTLKIDSASSAQNLKIITVLFAISTSPAPKSFNFEISSKFILDWVQRLSKFMFRYQYRVSHIFNSPPAPMLPTSGWPDSKSQFRNFKITWRVQYYQNRLFHFVWLNDKCHVVHQCVFGKRNEISNSWSK